jgi:uncharacterized protein (DUF1501 family)
MVSLLTDAQLCPSRRTFLAGAGAFVAWASLPRASYAAQGRDPRFIAVILRGAMDGLAVVPPIADPDFPALRGDLAIGTGGYGNTLPLDGFFALNDAMPLLHKHYTAGDALLIHAAATGYRDRSHFDGQDVLESGYAGPRLSRSGWLNRAAAAIPPGDGVAPIKGLAATPTVPLILRGQAPTLTWTPPEFKTASADTATRLIDLYAMEDPEFARVLSAGLDVEAMAGGTAHQPPTNGIAGAFRALASGAGRLLVDDGGPRVAALSYDGWDTHTNEGAGDGRLANLLGALDGALDALATAMARVWDDTVIAVMTEFGRTARINGNEGTDHGTATVAMLLGGAVNGGRVFADWPGLKAGQLYENRDLYPSTDLRAVLKGALRDHLGIDEAALTNAVFPDSIGIKPIDGLVG